MELKVGDVSDISKVLCIVNFPFLVFMYISDTVKQL